MTENSNSKNPNSHNFDFSHSHKSQKLAGRRLEFLRFRKSKRPPGRVRARDEDGILRR
jgi:hypothetical protein